MSKASKLARAASLLGGAIAILALSTQAARADSATMRIMVIIPDLTAARQALSERSAGLWTLDTGAGGLMVSASDGAAKTPGELVVYSSDRNLFQVQMLDGATRSALPTTGTQRVSTMNRAAFSVPVATPSANSTVSVLISGV